MQRPIGKKSQLSEYSSDSSTKHSAFASDFVDTSLGHPPSGSGVRLANDAWSPLATGPLFVRGTGERSLKAPVWYETTTTRTITKRASSRASIRSLVSRSMNSYGRTASCVYEYEYSRANVVHLYSYHSYLVRVRVQVVANEVARVIIRINEFRTRTRFRGTDEC
eukprot:scaffold359638_cov19-Prasinocladus_malaysianus.AAC.2